MEKLHTIMFLKHVLFLFIVISVSEISYGFDSENWLNYRNSVSQGKYNEVINYLESEANPNQFYKVSSKTHYEEIKRDKWSYRQPIFLAIHNNDYKMVQLLIEKGADINALRWGSPALAFAATKEKFHIFKLLLENKANPNITYHKGYTVLHAFAHRASTDKFILKPIELLLESGAKPNFLNGHYSALGVAVQFNNIELAHILLAAGANPNLTEKDGTSPYSYAISIHGKNSDITLLLKQYGGKN